MERARSEEGVFEASQTLSKESTGTLSLRRTRTWRFDVLEPGLLGPDLHERHVCRSCGSIPSDAMLPSKAFADSVSQELRRHRAKNKRPRNLSDLNGIKFAEVSRLVMFAWKT